MKKRLIVSALVLLALPAYAQLPPQTNICLGTQGCNGVNDVPSAGFSDILIGLHAGELISTGSSNVFVGTQTGTKTTTSSYNVYVGSFASQNQTGQANVCVGYKCNWLATVGDRNAYFGNSAMFNWTGGSDNVGVGYDVGKGRVGTAGGHTLLGSTATIAHDGDVLATAVGYGAIAGDHAFAAGFNAFATGNRSVAIGPYATAPQADTIIFGDPTSGYGDPRIGIGTANPDALAKLDITSSAKAFLPPRVTDAQMAAFTLLIVAPAEGYVFYNITQHKLCYYAGSSWSCF